MPIEKFKEIPAYLEANKDNEDVKKLIGGYNPLIELKDETVGELFNKTPVLKSFYDKQVSKGIETFKENNKNDLDKVKAEAIDDYVKKTYPEITEEQKRIKALELKGVEDDKRIKHGEILTTGIEFATAQEIPIDLVKLVKGDSHELTQSNLEKVKEIILKREKAAVEAFIKSNGRDDPHNADVDVNTLETQLKEALSKSDQKTALRLKREIAEKKKTK